MKMNRAEKKKRKEDTTIKQKQVGGKPAGELHYHSRYHSMTASAACYLFSFPFIYLSTGLCKKNILNIIIN